MESLADLQAQLIGLNQARAKGVRSISYTGNGITRTVEYKSDSEMREAQNDLQRRIAALSGNTNRTIRISTSKGLDHGSH
jgi:hypothetical protein